jgi:Mrp family chromosome partitioning ATPase
LLANLIEGDPGARRRYSDRRVVVTSCAEDGAERARVAELIAAVAARKGERVLFVDADVAGERQTASPGFRDVLRGECAVNSAAYRSADGQYLRMDKGRGGSEARREPRGDNGYDALTRAFRFFDLIVIDAGDLTDNYLAGPLTADADELLLIARLSDTPQITLAAVAEAVALMGSPVTGVLLVDRYLEA